MVGVSGIIEKMNSLLLVAEEPRGQMVSDFVTESTRYRTGMMRRVHIYEWLFQHLPSFLDIEAPQRQSFGTVIGRSLQMDIEVSGHSSCRAGELSLGNDVKLHRV